MREALDSYRGLLALDRRLGSPAATQNLLTLYRLNQGPVAATLENKRETFLPVRPRQVGSNLYPAGSTKEEIEAYLTAHPQMRDSILDLRAVVRRADVESLRRDLAKLRQYPALSFLHPGLQRELLKLHSRPDPKGFYSVPYSVAYADQLVRSHGLLNEAADLIEKDDEEFARYLRNRGRDLLTDDYESATRHGLPGASRI